MTRKKKFIMAALAAVATMNMAAAADVTEERLDLVMKNLVGKTAQEIVDDGSGGMEVAIGIDSDGGFSQGVAIGMSAVSEGIGSIAIGGGFNTDTERGAAYAEEEYDVAIGAQSHAAGGKSVALGSAAETAAENAIAIGREAKIEAESGIAIGTNAAVRGEKSEQGIAIGNNAKTVGKHGTAFGRRAYADMNTIAMGENAVAIGVGSNAIGQGAAAYAAGSIAIGADALIYEERLTAEEYDALPEEAQKMYILDRCFENPLVQTGPIFYYRNDSRGSDMEATAIGKGVQVTAVGGTALGAFATVDSPFGTAVGINSGVTGSYGLAMGNGALSESTGGVALGYISYAARGAGSLGYNPLTGEAMKITYDSHYAELYRDWQQATAMPATTPAEIEARDQAIDAALARIRDFQNTWQANTGALSIGNETVGMTRQITGVAAGSEDSDAVNLAQLKALGRRMDEAAFDAEHAMQSFKVGNGDATGPVITMDKERTRFDVVGAKDSGVVTAINDAHNAVVVGLNHAQVAAGINAGTIAVTNISAFFQLRDESGADRTLELKQGAVPAIELRGEDGKLDIAVAGSGDDARVTIQTHKDLGTNLDIRNNAAILALNEQIGSLGAWKLQANSGHEREIGKGDVVNFIDGTMTEVTVAGNDIQVDLNAAAKAKIGKIDGMATTLDDHTEKIKANQKAIEQNTNAIGELDERVGATEDAIEQNATAIAKNATDIAKNTTAIEQNATAIEQNTANIIKNTTAIEQNKTDITNLQDEVKKNAVTVSAGDNIEVTTKATGAKDYQVSLNPDIKVDSVTAKTVKADTVTTDAFKVGDKTYIDADGIHANDKKITKVAAGTEATDAANYGQVQAVEQAVAGVGHGLADLRNESREGDALGAALSALKPIQYDPLDRSQIMAGVGTYRGEQAVALGVAHYTNENTLLHAGVSYGGSSELMANAGVTWRFGSDAERRAVIPERYQAGPISSVYVMQDEMTKLLAENEQQREQIRTQEQKIANQQSTIEQLQKEQAEDRAIMAEIQRRLAALEGR